MSRKTLLLCAAVVLFAAPATAAFGFGYGFTRHPGESTVQEVGEAAEPLAIDFEALDLEGQPFHGINLKGRIVLLDFWAVWCAPCVDAFPKLTKLARDLEDEPFELVAIALYSGDYERVRKFLEAYEADYPNVVGEEDLAFRYGVIGYPTYLLIDPEGDFVKKYVGALPGLEERVKADVLRLKEEFGLDSQS